MIGGSSTLSVVEGEVPAGLIDGVNTVFTLAQAPQFLMLTYNGTVVPLEVGANGYQRSGAQLTLGFAPEVGAALKAIYFW